MKGGEGKRERERYRPFGCLLHMPNWRLNLKPRNVLWQVIELLTHWCTGWCSTNWTTLAGQGVIFIKCKSDNVGPLFDISQGILIMLKGEGHSWLTHSLQVLMLPTSTAPALYWISLIVPLLQLKQESREALLQTQEEPAIRWSWLHENKTDIKRN